MAVMKWIETFLSMNWLDALAVLFGIMAVGAGIVALWQRLTDMLHRLKKARSRHGGGSLNSGNVRWDGVPASSHLSPSRPSMDLAAMSNCARER